MVAYPSPRRLSVEDYLEYERTAQTRNEFYDGVLYNMAGASPDHNRIAMDTVAALGPRLRERGCEAFALDMRVRVDISRYSYPDVAVVCGEARFTDENPPSLLDPVLIFEVLSESTEKFDHEGKFDYYASRPSLKEYVLIAQDRPRVVRYYRGPDARDGKWDYEVYLSLEDIVRLESVDCELPMSAIYSRVRFQPQEEQE